MPSPVNRCDVNYNQLSTTTQSVNMFGRISSLIAITSMSSSYLKIFSAIFYGLSSFLIIVVNKIILTTFLFPSSHLLGFGQMIVTILVLQIGKTLRIINFPNLTCDIPSKIFPLPVFYIGNLICGLGGTQRLSLPMFTVLRRFAILMTMIGEYMILKVKPSNSIILTVIAMVGGAIIAGINDLAFELNGYILVLGNDFFTAANGVYMKKKLNSKDLGKYGLLFYNCLFMLPPMIILCWLSEDFEKAYNYNYWYDINFLISFFGSCIMGFILMYSTVLCTSHNSALTTTIVGCIKVKKKIFNSINNNPLFH